MNLIILNLFIAKNKNMKKISFVGIDVSKDTLDVCVKVAGVKTDSKIQNETAAIRKLLKPFIGKEVIVAMENTGRYNWPLYDVLAQMPFRVYVISPLHLNKSLGLARGKNDRVDASRIVDFIEKNHTELRVWERPSDTIVKLKILLTERALRVKIKRQLLCAKKDYARMKGFGLDKQLNKLNIEEVERLEKQIRIIEQSIVSLLKSDNALYKQVKLIQSIPGIGKILCWAIIAKTQGFTIIDSPRKFACYCGVVPFEHQSGTSVFRRPKVSLYADKAMKSLLHMGAMTAIRCRSDMQDYYNRRVCQGHNKMSVLNAVRNKLIHRVYAVIKNQKPYEFNLVVS